LELIVILCGRKKHEMTPENTGVGFKGYKQIEYCIACYNITTANLRSRGCKKTRLSKSTTKPFPKEVKEERFRQVNGLCELCNKPLGKGYHGHHRIPRSKGGPDTIDNCMVLHPACHLLPDNFELLHGHRKSGLAKKLGLL